MTKADVLKNLCDESIITKKKTVVRYGKKMRKVICGPGRKAVQGICQLQSGEEKRSQKIGHLKAKTKLKIASKSAQTQHRRAFSLKKRKLLGL